MFTWPERDVGLQWLNLIEATERILQKEEHTHNMFSPVVATIPLFKVYDMG